jgi:hypothetical protein
MLQQPDTSEYDKEPLCNRPLDFELPMLLLAAKGSDGPVMALQLHIAIVDTSKQGRPTA